MMKHIIRVAFLGLVLGAASCSKVEDLSSEKGYGVLSIDMSLADQTRAVTEDDLRSTASVKIYKADFSGLVRSYTYSDMPENISLVADQYRVDVEAGEIVKNQPVLASWDSKSYKGSKEFTIVAGKTETVQVEAKVCNAVTQVSFDSSVAENFNAGYTLTLNVDGDQSRQLVYDASKSGQEGYFVIEGLDEPSFTWTFAAALAKDGSQFLKSGQIENIEQGKVYKMNLKYTIKDGELSFTLMVDYDTEVNDDTIVFEPVSTGLAASSPFEIWARRATVHADVDPSESEGKTIQFSYSSNGTNWSVVNAVADGEAAWKAELTGLNPSTAYSYRLLIDGEKVGDELTLTTDVATPIPNGSFEYVSLVSGTSYYKFYDPNCSDPASRTKFWGSGNGEGDEGVAGSASMGVIITDIDKSDKVDGNQSLLAKNGEKLGMLTAGNIFTGDFTELIVGTKNGGKVNFGRPWTSRPSAMKLYCKYTTGQMDIVNGAPAGTTLTSGQTYDRAQIKFALGTWAYKQYGGTKNCPVQVNTLDESTFVDFFTDPSTIANGELIIYNDGYEISRGGKKSATTSGWIEYTIPLNYRNLYTYPTHIMISISASQYGDYFSGYSGSKLWVDKVELIYE